MQPGPDNRNHVLYDRILAPGIVYATFWGNWIQY